LREVTTLQIGRAKTMPGEPSTAAPGSTFCISEMIRTHLVGEFRIDLWLVWAKLMVGLGKT